MVLMLAGVGLFGALSGIVASTFLGQKEDDQPALLEEIQKLRAEVLHQKVAGVSLPSIGSAADGPVERLHQTET